jgi:K(+)-stimulated pyrophosphate-energized sodium pump
MIENNLFWFVPAASAIALFSAWYFYHNMKKESEGTETMKRIAAHVSYHSNMAEPEPTFA